MRRPEKSTKLYAELRDAILFRHFQPGAMLPRETELAEKYLVSRDTLRSALARLEEESLVRRVRGKGTYVSSGKEKPKITFFLPCPGSLQQISLFLTDVFHGIMEATHQVDCQVETLALSPTNDPDDIDWSKLLRIGPESNVVIMGFWFDKIFQFLRKSGSRVVFIHDGTFQKHDNAELLSHWVTFEKNQFDIGYRMASRLLDSGCRNPVFFSHYLLEKDQPKAQGVFSCFSDRGLVPAEHAVALPTYKHDLPLMQKIYDQTAAKIDFDGFLMDDSALFQYATVQNPGMPCGCFDYRQEASAILPETAFYSEFSLKQIGFDAVTELLKDHFRPFERQYNGRIYNHKGKELV